MNKASCSIKDCGRNVYAIELCNKHYLRKRRHGSPTHPVREKRWYRRNATPAERFWDNVALTANNQRCWLWQGGMNEYGYGLFCSEYHQYRAHRFAWFLVHKKHPDPALFLLHSCDTPQCVNPQHLREGTHQDNMTDMVTRGRQKDVGRTRCKNGHDLTADRAVRIARHGQWLENLCIACDRNRKRRYDARRREQKRMTYKALDL